MKTELYNLKRGDKFTLVGEVRVPPEAFGGEPDVVYTFDHIDGMYSYITDDAGNLYHFAAWTEVNKEE